MLNIYGNESIAFQTKGSPLANELIQIFQEVIDKRETITSVTERVKEIPKYVKDVTCTKLKNAIKKHTGITCTSVRLSKQLDMGYACLMNFGDKWGLTAHDVINRYSGQETSYMVKDWMRQLNITPRTAEDMRVVAESLNKETGKFTVTTLQDKTPCTMTLYFDPYGSFLIKECSHVNFEYFTAEEITGIILHEIGHMVSTLAHSADLCFRMQVYSSCMEYFLKEASNAEKAKLLKDGINLLDPKLKDKAGSAIDQCTAIDGYEDRGSWVGNIFGWFMDIFITTIQWFMLLPIISIVLEELYMVTREMFPEIYSGSFSTKKSSDHFYMSKQAKVCEQFADEYAARHGMAHAQASALNKLWSWVEYASSIGSYAGSTTSTLAYHLNKIAFVTMTLMYGDVTDGGGIYDGKTDRAAHLLEECTKAFKQNLSPEMAEYFMEDYIKTKNALKNRTIYDGMRDSAAWIRRALGYLLSTLPAMLVSGRISTEYEKLYRDGEKLRSNSLFFRATALTQLLKKK